MAPGSSGAGAHAGTGTVPKSKVRNNSAVPQEAVTPTRRDTLQAHPLHALHALHPLHPHLPHHALAATSLDWVPVSEYNTRANYGQSSRKTTNHSTADHDYSDLDNSISLESGAGRFVPVRPQPRALPLPAQHREGMAESVDDGAGSGPPHLYNHNQYPQLAANGVSPHANHATAAVMIVNPTTPITVTGHTAQPFNVPGNTNRNNLARAYHSTRNGTDGPTNNNTLHVNNNTGPVTTNGRAGTKTNNLMNNVFEPGPGSAPHNSDAAQSGGGGESVRAMGEAMVSSCPDAASVERRLGQIREYIRVTSSLVDTMRNSEDEEMSVRPMSVQSNGSAYSDSDLWQSELKAKMEVSQQRLAALQEQQKRLLKYQAEAKHQLAEMHHINRNRQSQENLPHHSAPQDNHHANATQNHLFQPNHQAGRIYNPNQIGVATALPHAVDTLQHQNTAQVNVSSGSLQETYHTVSSHSMELNGPSAHGHHQVPGRHQEDRYPSRSANIAPEEPQGRAAAGAETGGEGSEEEEQELLNEHGRVLQHKLRDLQLKKQHMEQLVADFQKLQAAERGARNTYSSSPEDSGAEDGNMHHGKCNKSEANIKNQDPFALVEISAIKAALQKTKDLMRRAERYEPQDSAGMHDDAYQLPSHSNINDNKSEGGGSAGGWSNDSSLCRVRNSIQHKITNHTPQHSATAAIQEQEASISSLQMLAQQLRQEAQSIADERKRLKQSLSKKDGGSKLSQKKVNAELGSSRGGSGCGGGRVSRGEARGSPGPMERKQIELQAELAEKQRQLEMILHKENELCGEVQNSKADSFSYAAMNQSYNSEQEEGESRADDVIFPAHSQHQPDSHHYRSADGSVYGDMMASALPPHLTNIYCSDSDSGTRGKSSQRMARNRRIRPPPLEHPPQDTPAAHVHSRSGSAAGSVHAEHRSEPTSAPALPPHLSHLGENINSSAPYPHMPPPAWCAIKSNQDVRTNQFTQNSHSQTMERLLGAQQVPFPPSVPFNMMMPYGMMGGGACGCSWWGPWCWQQLAAQQRELQQLRDQLNNVEERWRAETAPHALNNQVPPGNRANNYWDNFRSYSRQNLLSANSKTNANGHLGNVQPHNPHPLVERSHNTLHPSTLAGSAPLTPPTNTPKRNTNSATALLHNPVHQQPLATEEPIARHGRRNISYDTSHTFYTAPDVLNINQNVETDSNVISSSRIVEETIIAPMHCVSNVNINHRDDPLTERNLNMANPIPEIIQSHSNNLNSTNSFNNKKKSSSKLPAKNSSNRRNYSLDFVQNSNMDIASTSELPNLNLASSSHDARDKSTSKLFDLLRENVYSEVTALISANETHPDFLIQLFRDLQQLSSDSLRQHALQSIRDVLCQFSGVEGHAGTAPAERRSSEITLSPINNEHQNTVDEITISSSRDRAAFVDRDIINFMLAKSEETCTPELLETLKSLIIGAVLDAGHSMINSQKRLKEFLSKYEGARLREVSGDIIDNLVSLASAGPEQEELTRQPCDISESSILQDVAGSLNIFSSSDSQLHQMNLNVCSYDPWAPGGDSGVGSSHQPEGRFTQEAKVDLIDSVEMYNGDLAEADQTCHSEAGDPVGARALDESPAEMLPDVVETEEATPTEAEAEWVGLDRVPTRLHTDDAPANQKD